MSGKTPTESEQSVLSDNKKRKKITNPLKIKKWSQDQPLWRNYFNSFIDKEKKLEREDKLNRRKKADLPVNNFDSAHELYPYECYPLNILNRAQLNHKENSYPPKIRIWRNMRANPQIDMSLTSVPEIDPPTECIRKQELEYEAVDLKDVDMDDYATCRELGHARVPALCLTAKKTQQIVDRSTGERPGLVDGDYVTCELEAKGDYRLVYAQVCLRGTKGMHLIELTREREKTWKFCFYQALVALLAKTQLRYKFATSSNIDYIFDLAWMLFLHVGSLSVNHKLKLDDVVVYNYNYCVEFELVQELKNVKKISGVGNRFLGKGVKIKAMKRPELMKMTREIGQEKKKVSPEEPVSEEVKEIEEWFDRLPENCKNCVFRTGKFAIAFWNDGSFWYLFNPYRCDRFGFWNDDGAACVIKFCSRVALRRHLMILLIKAYGFESLKKDGGGKGEGIENLQRKNVKDEEEIEGGEEVGLENIGNDFKGNDTSEDEEIKNENLASDEKNLENEEMSSKNDEGSLRNTENDFKGDDTSEDEEIKDENVASDEKNLENEKMSSKNDEGNLENDSKEDNTLENKEIKDENVANDEKNSENEEISSSKNKGNLENTANDSKEDDILENKEIKNEDLASDENNVDDEISVEDDKQNVKDKEEIEEKDELNIENDFKEDNPPENTYNSEENSISHEKNSESEVIGIENNEENLITERINLEDKNDEDNKLTIQIFQLNYNCVKLHNLKLLNKNLSKPKTKLVTKIVDENDSSLQKSSIDSSDELKEKRSWLSENRITWSRVSLSPHRQARWHEYLVEEPRKLLSLWGSIHPTDSIFCSENRGKQIHACYLVCLGMSRIMAPEYWSSKTLDTVVMCGDRYYTCSKLQSDVALRNSIDSNNNHMNNVTLDNRAGCCWAQNLTSHFKICDILFEVKVLTAICGKLYSKYSLWKILQHTFTTHSYIVFTCESSCLAIFKFCGAYYVLDGNSFGPPIFDYGHGVLYLLRVTSFSKLIKILILTINSLESSNFSVYPVEILKIIDLQSPSNEIKERKLIIKNKKSKKNCKNKRLCVM